MRGTRARAGDAGSATVLVLGLAAVLSLVAGLLVAVGAVVVVRHRADSAADLAALAAAQRALDGAGPACRAATGVAAAAGVRLVGCVLVGDVAVVTVQLRPAGGLARLGVARSTARAGPAGPAP